MMSKKALKFLNNSINQDKLFESIREDILNIIKPYNFKKVIRIRESDVGEMVIELQDPIPTTLINEIDEYIGFNGIMDKTPHHIEISYSIKKLGGGN